MRPRPTLPLRGVSFPLVVATALLISLTSGAGPGAAAQEPSPGPPEGAGSGTDAGPGVAEVAPRADLSEANALVRDRKYAEAATLLAGLEAEYPTDPALLLMRGELLLALGRLEESRDVLRRAAEVDPARPRVQFQLGSALASTGDTAAALEAFGKEIEASDDPQIVALARLNRSMLFQRERRWSDAAAELEAVLQIRPEQVEAFGDLATLYTEAGRYDEARATLDRGLEAGFLSAEHYYSLGARLFTDERYEESVESLRRAVSLDPELAEAERSLAAALEKLGRADEAVKHLKRYLELAPGAPDAAKVAEQIRSAEGG